MAKLMKNKFMGDFFSHRNQIHCLSHSPCAVDSGSRCLLGGFVSIISVNGIDNEKRVKICVYVYGTCYI